MKKAFCVKYPLGYLELKSVGAHLYFFVLLSPNLFLIFTHQFHKGDLRSRVIKSRMPIDEFK